MIGSGIPPISSVVIFLLSERVEGITEWKLKRIESGLWENGNKVGKRERLALSTYFSFHITESLAVVLKELQSVIIKGVSVI